MIAFDATFFLLGAVVGLVAFICVRKVDDRRAKALIGRERGSQERDWVLAERRAIQMMRETLSAAELSDLAIRGYVEVASNLKPGSTYRVFRNPGETRTEERRDGRQVASYCVIAYPESYEPAARGRAYHDPIPPADLVMAQVLMLKHAEMDYLLAANRFPVVSLAGRFDAPFFASEAHIEQSMVCSGGLRPT